MSEPALIAFAGATLLVVVALLLLLSSRKADLDNRVTERFSALRISNERAPDAGPWRRLGLDRLADVLWRAGLKPQSWHLGAALLNLALVAAVGWRWHQGAGLVALPLLLMLVFYGALRWRSQRRAAAMLRQLPMFLDQMIRGLSAGRTVDSAFILATEQCMVPLREVMERVGAQVRLGMDIAGALGAAARLHALRELQLLALAIHVNTRFGGSVRDLLGNVITMIRQREQAQDELRALTGETRMSAWLLGLLPLTLAGYMVAVNPGYLESMWDDPGGRTVLSVAVGLQAIGALLLWRMIRSI